MVRPACVSYFSPSKGRPTAAGVMGVLVTSALLLTLCAQPALPQERVVSARAGLVTGVEGEVVYHCHEKGEGVEQLRSGERLHDGDLVYTSKGGRVTWVLNPDSYMMVSADSAVRVYESALDRMHFDVERGEVIVVSRSLEGGTALVVHAPPGLLTVYKPGRYLFRVAEGGETEAAVERGELRYEEKGRVVSVKKGRRVNFIKVRKGGMHKPETTGGEGRP
ncbi:MAG: FecR family protein [Acidobacteriota bacterium]|nr:FecR family protein [Acidobacteriota bacterium]